jgi:hypothetical protein
LREAFKSQISDLKSEISDMKERLQKRPWQVSWLIEFAENWRLSSQWRDRAGFSPASLFSSPLRGTRMLHDPKNNEFV